jgi:hypothetical protein
MSAAGLPGAGAAVRIHLAGRSFVLTSFGASVAVGSGRSDDNLAGRNTDDVAWTAKPSGTAAEGVGPPGIYQRHDTGISTRPACSDGEFVYPLGQIDRRLYIHCAGAAASATTAAVTVKGLRSSAGAAAAVGKINRVAACRES